MNDHGPTGCVLGFAGGLLGVLAVLLGAVFEVPRFCPREGYLGTEFLRSFLYAMGNDWAALCIVSVLWALYVGIPFAALGIAVSLFRKRQGRP